MLHGSGEARIRAGLAYIAVNLTASLLFLVGVALIYGVTGTLNMADLAVRIPGIAAADRGLFHIGAALLGVAFLIKCAAWPLGFWLVPTYAAASAPAAAAFAILSKVGVYVVIRLEALLFSPLAGPSAGFGEDLLLGLGLATVTFGSLGLLASRSLSRAAGFVVMISSGTVLAVVGTGDAAALGGGLYYLVGSTLACGALFLIAEVLDRDRSPGVQAGEAVFDDEYRDPSDDDERNEPGLIIPASVAALGGAMLVCAVMIAGLPPLAGFVGKLAIFNALIGIGGGLSWTVVAALSVSGLLSLIAWPDWAWGRSGPGTNARRRRSSAPRSSWASRVSWPPASYWPSSGRTA
ncbi:proton-conducting transporter membrane subunit [Brevundimonas sp.]|uniref:proton-conducting transporter transmembrane domain-containing protein n=1 Tax=Brevundimonas sp. TaxID=1871086 RepID=UPI0035B4E878